jgi:hypothetical protein
MACRICLEEEGPFVHPCQCKGNCGNVHSKCLSKWIEESRNDHCEICCAKYNKQDVASCNMTRFLRNLFSCNMGDRNQLHLKFCCVLFGVSSVIFWVLPIGYVIIQTALTGLISTLILLWIHMFEEEKFKIYNVVVMWKLAYTIPFLINCIIYYLQYQQDCDLGCAFFHEACDIFCPIMDTYVTKNKAIDELVYVEVLCFWVVIVIRAIVVAYYNFRTLQFVDFEERKPLLSSSSSSSSDASGGEATSISFGLTGITTVSEVA